MNRFAVVAGSTILGLLTMLNAAVYAYHHQIPVQAAVRVPMPVAPINRPPGLNIGGRTVQPYAAGDTVIVEGDPVLSRLANQEEHMTSKQTNYGMDGPVERELIRRARLER